MRLTIGLLMLLLLPQHASGQACQSGCGYSSLTEAQRAEMARERSMMDAVLAPDRTRRTVVRHRPLDASGTPTPEK